MAKPSTVNFELDREVVFLYASEMSFRRLVGMLVVAAIIVGCAGDDTPHFDSASLSGDVITLRFDPSGALENESDLDAISAELREAPSMLLVYVLGWKHSGDVGDSNYTGFKQHFAAIKRSLQLANSPLKTDNTFSGTWWNVQIPAAIIANHNDILGPIFRECVEAIYAYAAFPRPSLAEALSRLASADGGIRLAAANDIYQYANSVPTAEAVITSLSTWRTFQDKSQGITNHLEIIQRMPSSVFVSQSLRSNARTVFSEIRDSGLKVYFLEEAERKVGG